MKKNKFIISLLVFFLGFNLNLQAEITVATPSVILTQLATATSFSSDVPLDQASIDTINETTATVVNQEEMKIEVEADAVKLGEKIDQAEKDVLAGEDVDNEKLLMVLNSAKDDLASRIDLEPTLGTYIYDSGPMVLTQNTSSNYNQSTDASNMFDQTEGAQQARIVVYIDFKRQVQWGDVTSTVKFSATSRAASVDDYNSTSFTNTKIGGSSRIGDDELSLNRQLNTIYKNDGTELTAAESYSGVGAVPPIKHDINSLVLANGKHAPYLDTGVDGNGNPIDGLAVLDREDMQTYISHDTDKASPSIDLVPDIDAGPVNANAGVNVGALIVVNNETANTGTLTASFEAATGENFSEADAYAATIIRFDATKTVEAEIFEGDSSR
tara:strand:+ start:10 stop:1161 length:1152 start_codon:yes stop_codon:yes gene_type:complete